MLKWLKNLGKQHDIHIYVHVDGVLNVERQETQERKPGPQNGDSAYFISEEHQVGRGDPQDINNRLGDITIPEIDFGDEEP